jgi:hypothetical protein
MRTGRRDRRYSGVCCFEKIWRKWTAARPMRPGLKSSSFYASDWIHASASAMRDRIDQPEARHAQQADKDQGNGVHDHAMLVIILAFRAFVFRKVGNQ